MSRPVTVYEFCQYRERGLRCIAGAGHPEGVHDLQPAGSVSVRTIERQESILHRLGEDPPGTQVVEAIDKALEVPSEPDPPVSTAEAAEAAKPEQEPESVKP